jgi:hypothetical protein
MDYLYERLPIFTRLAHLSAALIITSVGIEGCSTQESHVNSIIPQGVERSLAIKKQSPKAIHAFVSYTETPASTYNFVQSLGIVTKFGDPNSNEQSHYATAKPLLTQLGIEHIRDSADVPGKESQYNGYLQDFAAAGIKVDAVTDWPNLLNNDDSPNTIGQAGLLTFLEQNNCTSGEGCVEAIEDPNEMDNDGNQFAGGEQCGTFASPRQCTLQDVQGAVEQTWALDQSLPIGYAVPVVYGPSLVTYPHYSLLSGYSGYMTYGNLHNYYGGITNYPGFPSNTPFANCAGYTSFQYGTIPYVICYAQQLSASDPLVTTETGYAVGTDASNNQVSTAVQVKYTMRTALMQFATNNSPADSTFNAGIKRTYFFNFVDQCSGNTCQTYGFLDPAFNKRPVYVAFQNLTNKLQDSSTPFTATPLTYTLTDGSGNALPSNVNHLLLQKHDHTWRLFLWIEDQDTSPTQQTQTVELSSPTSFSTVTDYAWQDSGSYTTNILTSVNGIYSFTISDRVTELNLTP